MHRKLECSDKSARGKFKEDKMIGHSEGGEIVARIATDNPTTEFDNIGNMAPRIEKPSDKICYGL